MDKNERFSIVLFSGTVDKLMAATTLASGAVAMGKDVMLFLTNWGLVAFRKDDWKTNRRVSKDFEDYGPVMFEMFEAKRVQPWMATLKTAMELGNVKVVACGMTMDLFDLKLEDLEPVVSEVTGVASFIDESEGGTTLFI
jgi:peroxiredoxin family protein